MTKKDRYAFVIDYFQKNLPEAETELDYEDPYELLVAVILSAQCTDKRVNLTTPALFQRFPNVSSLSQTNFDELLPYIKSISHPTLFALWIPGYTYITSVKYQPMMSFVDQ